MNVQPVEPIDYAEWLQLIGELETTYKLTPTLPTIGSLFADGSEKVNLEIKLSSPLEDIPKEVDPKAIVSSCKQMKKFCLSQGNVPEPYWRAALSVIRFFPDARKHAHRLSAGHPDYTAADTDAKLDDLESKDVGPYLCETFESCNPNGCDGCEHRGEIKSPINLGTVFKSAPAPQVVVGGATLAIPNPPEPYVRTEVGSIIIQPKESADGTKPAPIIIYPYDLYPITRIYDAVHKQESVLWRVHLPVDGIREFSIPLGLIYNNNALSELLANSGVLVKLGKPKERLVNYIIDYINELQRVQTSRDFSARMGWQSKDTQFVLGYTAALDDGRTLPIPKSLMEKNVAADRYVSSKGSLSEWSRVINTYDRPGQEPFAFGFFSAFGAPLMKLTGFDGALISIIDDGGTGKTTMQQAILSVYGDPSNKDILVTPQDTEKSVIAKLSSLCNLPVILDDFSGTDERDVKALADLCYAVSQGKGRDRLNPDGSISDRRERWSFIAYVVANLKSVRTEIVQCMKEVEATIGERSAERFWIASIAANIVGGRIAKRLGLHDIDVERVMQWALHKVAGTREKVNSFNVKPMAVISEFLNEHIDCILTVNMRELVSNPPRNKIIGRMEMHTDRLFVATRNMRDFLTKQGLDADDVANQLHKAGVLVDRSFSKNLTAGTGYVSGSVRSWVFAVDHALFADHTELVRPMAPLKTSKKSVDSPVTGN